MKKGAAFLCLVALRACQEEKAFKQLVDDDVVKTSDTWG